jgi:DNA (cytosine-5)-methyltransferase 1
VNAPTYRVPTMAEVRALPWNGFVVASLFAGGGGSSTGYRMAGYRVAYANDVVPEARETYLANCADYTTVDGDDVRTVPGSRVLDAVERATGRRHLDVLDGSPPCQAFSTAGPRDRTWGREVAHADGTTQRSDDLFFEYARILGETMPSAFVAENVSGLVKGVARGYFKQILAALRAVGYRVEARLLDAQWLGVPQMRQRVIFMGVREDLASSTGAAPAFPGPLSYRYPLSIVCPDVVRLEVRGYGKVTVDDAARQPSRTVAASGYSSYSDDYDLVRRDGTKRKFTLDELRAIGSFPPDYVMPGTYKAAWARIGNSVPPLMMRAIAEAVRDGILEPTRAAPRG